MVATFNASVKSIIQFNIDKVSQLPRVLATIDPNFLFRREVTNEGKSQSTWENYTIILKIQRNRTILRAILLLIYAILYFSTPSPLRLIRSRNDLFEAFSRYVLSHVPSISSAKRIYKL